MHHIIQTTSAVAMWLAAVCIMAITRGTMMTDRLDSVNTYQLIKVPQDFRTARDNVIKAFDGVSFDGSCLGSTNFTVDPTCKGTRSTLVDTARIQFGCNNTKSPACACIIRALRSVSVSDAGGVYTGYGLNLQGVKRNVTAALENCRWLHRNSFQANKPTNSVVRRTGMLFYLTTLTTFNVLDHVIIHRYTREWGGFLRALIHVIVGLAVVLVGILGNLAIDAGSPLVVFLISIVPAIFLVYYEFFLPVPAERPWVHPFYFVASLGVVSTLALVENGVFDYDVLVTELLNDGAIGAFYIVTVWYYLAGRDHSEKSGAHKSRAVHNALVFIVVASVARPLITLFANYTTAPALNSLWAGPLVFVLFALGSVIWLPTFFHSEEVDASDVKVAKMAAEHYTLRTSLIHLLLQAFILWYYFAINAKTKSDVISPAVFNSVQINTSATWQIPA